MRHRALVVLRGIPLQPLSFLEPRQIVHVASDRYPVGEGPSIGSESSHASETSGLSASGIASGMSSGSGRSHPVSGSFAGRSHSSEFVSPAILRVYPFGTIRTERPSDTSVHGGHTAVVIRTVSSLDSTLIVRNSDGGAARSAEP
jgi:hypothetical protein